jgi:tetratricopeptide (TPR) repeat protein
LAIRIETLLISILILSSFILPVFAEEVTENLIFVETDKPEYSIGDTLTISGMILEKKMPVVALRLFDPDDNILTANQIEIKDDNSFSKTIFLDAPFYEKEGTYTITVEYGKLKTETTFKMVTDKEDELTELLDDIIPEVLVITDKPEYRDGDTVVIYGFVTTIEEPSVLVGIYDPFGNPSGFYFGEIDSQQEFLISFLVKEDVNFKAEGKYSVIALYGNSQDIITFDFLKKEQTKESTPVNVVKPEDKTNNAQNANNKIVKENKIDNTKLQNSNTQTSTISNGVENNNAKENEFDNLTVEDIELGIILNNMKLNCDKNTFKDVVSYYDGMGPALFRLCKYDDAIFYFDQSLVDDPNNVAILTNKGSALSKLGHYEEAIYYFNSALDMNPKYVPALNNKANALANLGHYEDAVSIYETVLLLSPDYSISLQNLKNAQEKINSKSFKLIENSNEILREPEPTFVKKEPQPILNDKTDANFIDQINNALSSFGNALFGFLS